MQSSLKVEISTLLTIAPRPGLDCDTLRRMEARRPVSNPIGSAAEDHHCPAHTTFTAACDSCVRARAAFLPYQAAAHISKPQSARSFGFTDQMSEAEIHALAEPLRDQLRREAIRYAAWEAVDEIIRDIIPENS
jgi:hypothetical protein